MVYYLFALFFCGALSHYLYHSAAMVFSPDVPTKRRKEIIDDFLLTLLVAISVVMVIYFVYKGLKYFLSRPGSTLL